MSLETVLAKLGSIEIPRASDKLFNVLKKNGKVVIITGEDGDECTFCPIYDDLNLARFQKFAAFKQAKSLFQIGGIVDVPSLLQTTDIPKTGLIHELHELGGVLQRVSYRSRGWTFVDARLDTAGVIDEDLFTDPNVVEYNDLLALYIIIPHYMIHEEEFDFAEITQNKELLLRRVAEFRQLQISGLNVRPISAFLTLFLSWADATHHDQTTGVNRDRTAHYFLGMKAFTPLIYRDSLLRNVPCVSQKLLDELETAGVLLSPLEIRNLVDASAMIRVYSTLMYSPEKVTLFATGYNDAAKVSRCFEQRGFVKIY